MSDRPSFETAKELIKQMSIAKDILNKIQFKEKVKIVIEREGEKIVELDNDWIGDYYRDSSRVFMQTYIGQLEADIKECSEKLVKYLKNNCTH